MKRTHRLRWQAAAIMTVAAFTVAACSSGSSSSSSRGIGLEQLERRADRVRARHHPDPDHHRQPPAADRARRARLQRDLAQVMDLVVRLSREHGITIILVEQNARGALAIADHGVVLNLGRVVAAADAATLAADVALRHHYLGF